MDQRTIKSITWTHGRDVVICALGEPIRRRVPRYKGHKRDYSLPAEEINDGGRILNIEDSGAYYLVFYKGISRWHNPFMAGRHTGTSVEYAS